MNLYRSSLKNAIRFSGIFSKFKTGVKITNCDNQALVGCIPIAAVAVDLNLKS